jgi:hypothetical protein
VKKQGIPLLDYYQSKIFPLVFTDYKAGQARSSSLLLALIEPISIAPSKESLQFMETFAKKDLTPFFV